MNTLPFSLTLDHLIGVTLGTAINHCVQQEAVMLHILALAATSDAITHQPTGQQVTPAKFSILIQTPDFRPPPWVLNEWHNAWYHRTYNSKGQPRIISEPVAIGLPRSERILAALESRHDSLQHSAIEDHIDDEKLCMTAPHLHPIKRGKCDSHVANCVVFYLAAHSGHTSIFQGSFSPTNRVGVASLIATTEEQHSNHISCIAMPDWKHLSGITGPDFLSKLGWIIEVPVGFFCRLSALPLASTKVFEKLDALRLANTSFAYKPTDYARTLLDRQVEESRVMVNQLPPEQRDVALPDPYLAWHLAALVAQLCADDEETHDDVKALQAARLGIMVATWATRQHLHHYRHAFPADGAGSFVGQDLSIFRLLNLTPLPVRAFMAHLRCVNEDACLASLRRAVDAGLALEAEPGLFAAIPSPRSSVTETRMDHTPTHFGPTEPAPCGTDNIDGMPRHVESYNSPPESK